MAGDGVKLFLSCVSDEFGDYREALRKALTLPNVEVKIQEDFKPQGGDTLRMLEEYIEKCEAVVHFVGDMAGSTPAATGVDDLLGRRPGLEARFAEKGLGRDALKTLSYTQWEAWLAIGFDKDLLIVEPAAGVVRGPNCAPTDASRAAQAQHLKRLRAINRYPGPAFTSADNLIAQIFGSAVIKALVKAAGMPARQPRNLPFASLGSLFVGREAALDDLRAALTADKGVAVAGRALHGLGGVGKTRLAIEYAWRHAHDHSALLFVRAEDAAALSANLAALAGAEVLDLPEKETREDATKIEAVLRWLEAHPTWLLILDNVDDENAVSAVTKLMPRLKGGHVIVTARAANFPASMRKLELDVLAEDAATRFLLERTADDRETATNDEAQARALARELGGLALGLEQAGAYIAAERIGFARYLKIWNESRDKALGWSDPSLTGSERTLATTWETSVARLTPESRRLLDRLAMLAPDPIPDSFLDVPVPGGIPAIFGRLVANSIRNFAGRSALLGSSDALSDSAKVVKSESEASDAARSALAGLYAYSLITRATGEGGSAKGFVMHRLVQDFVRRAMTEARRGEALREALGWVDRAFVGDPGDVRSWRMLDLLAPHTLAVARRADEAAIARPTARLFNELALLSAAKARYAEAEPLFRRALAIGEATLGPNHPKVAIRLNNLATLLKATNRLTEAEPLYRRARAILEASHWPDYPNVAIRLNDLAELLRVTNHLGEAEPLHRRALAISKKSVGADHPDVAIRLNNLATLLQAMNRIGEAEPFFRRALAIDEKSFGPDHPNVARDLNNLAILLRQTNRVGEAEPLFRRALDIDEANYGPDHPNVARDVNNLELLLQATNRLGEAEPLIRRALAIDEASYGTDHPNVAIDLNNLAQLLKATNRLGEAEPLMRRALAIDEASFGPDHPNVVIRLNNLALLLQATNRLDEAEPMFRRALAIDEKNLGADHPNTVTVPRTSRHSGTPSDEGHERRHRERTRSDPG